MTSSPLVSIVTPTFGRAELLRHTMASVRGQFYRNIEHIVVDGGSTDGTVDLLRASEGTYPLRWVSEPDEGMYQAVNKGLRMASGDILAYLNSDDLYLPWTVEAVVDAFRRRADAGFVYGDVLVVDDADGRADIAFQLPFDLDHVRRVGFLGQPAVFWRREAYEAVGPFDERLRYVADCDYWMRAGRTQRFVKVDEVLAVERNHGATLREARGSQVWTELEAVRAAHVVMAGRSHRRRVLYHRLRTRLYVRRCWTLLLLQALLPARLRLAPWRRALGSGRLEVRRLGLLMRVIPGVGRVRAAPMLGPSRHWLEPDAGEPGGRVATA
jgi:glycosyltransferase involved in cell wall biosynthesis